MSMMTKHVPLSVFLKSSTSLITTSKSFPGATERTAFERTSFKRANSTQTQSPNTNSPKKSGWTVYLAAFSAGALAYYYFPVTSVLDYYLNSKLPHSPDQEAAYNKRLEEKLASSRIVKMLSVDPQWEQSRSWDYVDENAFLQSSISITDGVLAQPGGIAVPPVVFTNKQTRQSVTIVYLGSKLCGYPFIVHGGILATILDETFRKTASMELEEELKTGSLELSYRFPTVANNFVVIKSVVAENPGVNGGIEVTGTIESVDGKLLVKGKSVVFGKGGGKKGKKFWLF